MAKLRTDDGWVRSELFSGSVGASDGAEGEFCRASGRVCGGVLFGGRFVGVWEEAEGLEWAAAVEDCVGRVVGFSQKC